MIQSLPWVCRKGHVLDERTCQAIISKRKNRANYVYERCMVCHAERQAAYRRRKRGLSNVNGNRMDRDDYGAAARVVE